MLAPLHVRRVETARTVLRWLAAASFVAAGANHFVYPDFYRKIIPPQFPRPDWLVSISGVCEIAGGAGLLIPHLRRPAGWGLIALLIAVFPANVYMAVQPDRVPDLHVRSWLLWLRLPFQAAIIAWVWFAALGPRRTYACATSQGYGQTTANFSQFEPHRHKSHDI